MKCVCGWPLPASVMPVDIDDYMKDLHSSNVTVLGDACVVLNCPNCGKGHSFFHEIAVERADVQSYMRGKHANRSDSD